MDWFSFEYLSRFWVEAKYGEPDEDGYYDCFEDYLFEQFTDEQIREAISSTYDKEYNSHDDQLYDIIEHLIGQKLHTLYVADYDGLILMDKK